MVKNKLHPTLYTNIKNNNPFNKTTIFIVMSSGIDRISLMKLCIYFYRDDIVKRVYALILQKYSWFIFLSSNNRCFGT
jgi:hypothetical protein